MTEIEPGKFLALLDEPETLTVIDVRTPEEFEEWSIPRAINIPLDQIETRIGEIPTDGLVVLVCGQGLRAEEASGILADQGVDAMVLAGGMAAWARTYDEVALHLGGVTIVQIRRRGKGCLSYVVGAEDSCVVIDPSIDIERPIAIANARGWQVTHVADTHLHADHVSGARLLAEATGAALVLSDSDDYAFAVEPLAHDAPIPLGRSHALGIGALRTPGHTMGSTTFFVTDVALFTGDTLFIESVGRPDLADKAEQFALELFRSLHDELLQFDDDMLVLPAHYGPSVEVRSDHLVGSTLGELRTSLAALSMDAKEFVAWSAGQATNRPPNYQSIVEANQGLVTLTGEETNALELGPNRCAVATTPGHQGV